MYSRAIDWRCVQGAKNHGVILPDASKDLALSQLAGAAFGAAGQRCMALPVAVFVGEAKQWIPELVERAKKLKVNAGAHSAPTCTRCPLHIALQ